MFTECTVASRTYAVGVCRFGDWLKAETETGPCAIWSFDTLARPTVGS